MAMRISREISIRFSINVGQEISNQYEYYYKILEYRNSQDIVQNFN